MEAVAGGLEAGCMIDLGVIEIELARGSMLGQGAQERVDEDIEALTKVIAGLDDAPAVAVDESGKIGGEDLPAHKDIGTFLEVPDPEVMGVIPGPTFSHLLFDGAELEAGCARILEMANQGGARENDAVKFFEKSVDGGMRALGLLSFELDGDSDDLRRGDSGMAPVFEALSSKGVESSRAIAIELSAEGRKGGLSRTSTGKDDFLAAELFLKILDLFRLHLVEENGAKEIAPE
jgi:hypothetical protein